MAQKEHIGLHYYKFPAYITHAINSKYYGKPYAITYTNDLSNHMLTLVTLLHL